MPTEKDIQKLEQAHVARVDQYGNEIKKAYNEAIASAIAVSSGISFNPEKPFAFSAYGKEKEITEIIDNLTTSIVYAINAGTASEWEMSGMANDNLVDESFAGKGIPKENIAVLYDRNIEAYKSFQSRKIDGFSLSDRVWNQTRKFKSELEMSIDVGLLDGRSAAEISRDIRGYLNEPERLFRRVRDARGNLHLSKNAEAYHPGQGVYRSSFKNAHRLARTETNMAYRTADLTRWKQIPFILGYEVKLSGRHAVSDVCDRLKGKYPAKFKFTGWHTQCFCYIIPIMANDKDFDKYIDSMLDLGSNPSDYEFGGKVEKLPDNFITWAKDNVDKVAKGKGTPYFVRDNLDKGNIHKSALKF